jgi:hypothetical protein
MLGILSALFSLACLVVLVVTWTRVYTAPSVPQPADHVVTTPDEVSRYLKAYIPSSESSSNPPIFIPTGMYIATMQFKGPYKVQMSGYVWQRYADDVPNDIREGVVFPESEYTRVEQVYSGRQGDEQLIGWSFRVTLREQFDYAKYPIGRQQIWVLLWHPDFESNVFLEPDLESYTTLDPASLPGLDKDVVLENWKLERSFFSFRDNRYNTNFGVRGYAAQVKQPELHYNVSIKRYLLDVVVSKAIVPLVILIQLFVLVMVIGTNRERLDKFGVRPGGVIFTCAAFCFAVLLAQNSLRNELEAGGLVYFESLYILTYLVILAVAVNSVLLVAYPNSKLFREHDNLLAKVVYWPAILLALVVVTLLMFS